MKIRFAILAASLLLPALRSAPATHPFSNEALHYSINWPSGLGLGEVSLTSALNADGVYSFGANVDATFPGVPLSLAVKSNATDQFCSTRLDKTVKFGSKKSEEKTEFDQQAGSAKRTTSKDGGTTDMSISPCSKDALAFFYFLRQELVQGRIPPAQKVYYGAAYQVRVEYKGSENVALTNGAIEAEHMIAHIKGPVTDIDVDLFFRKDAVRTPVAIRVPVSIGTFSVELTR